MKKSMILCVLLLLVATAAFSQLATTFADLDNDISTYSRVVTHVDNDTKIAPTIDGVITPGEYTWSSGIVSWNGQDNNLATSDGSDGPGDCDLRGLGKGFEPTDSNDLSYIFYLSHDNSNIYIGVEITDDLFQYPIANQHPGKVDSIELSFDGDDTRNGIWNATTEISLMNKDGGKIIIGGNKDGNQVDEDTADCLVGNSTSTTIEGKMYGSFTLPDGSHGRFDGTTFTTNTKVNSGPSTDVEFSLKYESPSTNANRVLELRMPKTGLGMTVPGWQEEIIGINLTVNDFDDTDVLRDHQMIYDNAGENLDGEDMLKDINDDDVGLLKMQGSNNFDATNLGVFDQMSWKYECAWPRFRLAAGPPPPPPSATRTWELYN